MVLEFMQYGDLASFMKSHRFTLNLYTDTINVITRVNFICIFRPVGGQSSVIGEVKFCAFATDVSHNNYLIPLVVRLPANNLYTSRFRLQRD